MSKEDQRRVFDKFYQGDGSHATKGNGLGLSLVQKIIDLHQGSITIRSGNGQTTFTIFLPK
ncbi:sensor histidine kinase [Erysipelothrix inopinata]|uniref:histidine kinase n=1 Tax=Erysipelothrix inopinata TaxID=225084 RepID=A0A7G9S1V1_9FIRM|nr:sensor histidine kinase [Erysipelothrix inopinata]